MEPSSGVTAPVKTLMRVDFPAPFSPTNAWTSPACASNDTFLSARTPANDFEMEIARRMGLIVHWSVVQRLVIIAVLLWAAFATSLAAANPELLTQHWKAHWIGVPGAGPHDYGVYHFRRTLDLSAVPQTFTIHVSGDNRYQLFVNGERVAAGPARGDLFHWRYETVDIAPKLKPGRNALAAVVWNDGPYAAVAQISNQTGFLVQGDTSAEQIANTGSEWRCIADKAYSPHPLEHDQMTGYFALGPAEQVD